MQLMTCSIIYELYRFPCQHNLPVMVHSLTVMYTCRCRYHLTLVTRGFGKQLVQYCLLNG